MNACLPYGSLHSLGRHHVIKIRNGFDSNLVVWILK